MKTRNSLFAIRNSIFDIQYLIRAFIFFFIIITMFASNTFAQTTANFSYDSTYGGLTGYQTSDSAQVNITRNGFGRHPVKMAYGDPTNPTTTYNFQDNAAGRRVVQKRTSGGVTTTSHFLFGGGLRPKVEFRNDGTTTTAHYTIYGPGGRVVSYITTDSSGSPVRLTPIHDRLGSTRALIDSSSGGSGNVEARFGYNTLGKPTETDGCTDNSCDQYREYPYRFQGHRYLPFEDETATAGYTVGVTDNVDRLYSHDHGLRFMHTDIAGQSISPYSAYGDDPVNMVDLDGLIRFLSMFKSAMMHINPARVITSTGDDKRLTAIFQHREVWSWHGPDPSIDPMYPAALNKHFLYEPQNFPNDLDTYEETLAFHQDNTQALLDDVVYPFLSYLRNEHGVDAYVSKKYNSVGQRIPTKLSDIDVKIVTDLPHAKQKMLAEMAKIYFEGGGAKGLEIKETSTGKHALLTSPDFMGYGEVDLTFMNEVVSHWSEDEWSKHYRKAFPTEKHRKSFGITRQKLANQAEILRDERLKNKGFIYDGDSGGKDKIHASEITTVKTQVKAFPYFAPYGSEVPANVRLKGNMEYNKSLIMPTK